MTRRREAKFDPADIDPIHRIFVNRNLRLGSIRAIGFDMDHTLAIYKSLPFERLAFQKAQEKLAELGYPRASLRLKYKGDFVVRGLLVDKGRGNILKMDRHHYVTQAYHGTRKIPSEMRKNFYAKRRIRLGGASYATVDTLFSLPEISLYAQMVDLLDGMEERPNYRALYHDVRGVMDEAHADGSIKRIIARDPLRYLEIDPQLPETLGRMRDYGLKLFLLTNSEANYTALIMNQLFPEPQKGRTHWTDFFDLVVVRAGKPAFFMRHGPLRPLGPKVLKSRKRSRARFAYTGGCVHALERALGVAGDEILYFGDHTYGDILKSKRVCGWRTAMIIQGLERELTHQAETHPVRMEMAVLDRRIDRLVATRDFLERAAAGLVEEKLAVRFIRSRGLVGGRRQLRSHSEAIREEIKACSAAIDRLEIKSETTFNPYWGPMFRAGRETSHFANQVQKFACIYTSMVSNFLNYPMEKYFVATHAFMPHEL